MSSKALENKKFENKLTFKPFYKFSAKTKYYLTLIFVFVVIAESFSIAFQMIEIYQNKSAKDVSLLAFSLLLATNIIWVLYGTLVVPSIPLVVSGTLYVTFSLLIVIGILIYGNGEKK